MEWVLPFDADFKSWIRTIPEVDAKPKMKGGPK